MKDKGYDMSPRKMMAGGHEEGNFGVKSLDEFVHENPEAEGDHEVHGKMMTDRERGMPKRGEDGYHRPAEADHGPMDHGPHEPMSRERRPHHVHGR